MLHRALSASLCAAGALLMALTPATASAQEFSVPTPTLPSHLGPEYQFNVGSVGSFATNATEFFSAALAPIREFRASGCQQPQVDQRGLCLDVLIQTGIEASTGLGVARSMVSRVRTNSVGGWWTSQFPFLTMGPTYNASQPGAIGVANDTRSLNLDMMQRSTSTTAGTQWETYVPRAADASIWLRVRCFDVPGRCRPDGLTEVEGSVRLQIVETTTVTPEPSTYALLGTGLLTLGTIAARRRKRAEA